MSKILKITLLALSYTFILTIFTNSFDPDLGWHLRFGRDVFTQSSFPYADTYTWTYLGQPWVNHEWGGDILFWFIYQTWGYTALALIMAGVPLAAFCLAIKIFKNKLEALDLIVVFALLFASRHLLLPRLAMFTPLFLAIIWYFLEKCPKQNNYWAWPIIFWVWAALHGSYILGFIVIFIYLTGHLWNLFCQKYLPKLFQSGLWGWKEIKRVALATIASMAIIALNPYGFKIFNEATSYLSLSYFKTHITEWAPSYTYPVFWLPLIIAAISLPLIFIAIRKQRITWPQLILWLAFWWSAWQYKRNALLLMVVCAPLLALFLQEAGAKIFAGAEKLMKIIRNFTLAAALLLFLAYALRLNYVGELWTNAKAAKQSALPFAAAQFLQKNIIKHPAYLFNEFSWGGYLNWQLPQDLIFLDGRSAATWQTKSGQSFLQYYQDLNYLPGGLKKIAAGPTQYVILSKIINLGPPDKINQWLFAEKEIKEIFSSDSRILVKDIKNSPNWRLIYEDNLSWVWERVNPLPEPAPTLL